MRPSRLLLCRRCCRRARQHWQLRPIKQSNSHSTRRVWAPWLSSFFQCLIAGNCPSFKALARSFDTGASTRNSRPNFGELMSRTLESIYWTLHTCACFIFGYKWRILQTACDMMTWDSDISRVSRWGGTWNYESTCFLSSLLVIWRSINDWFASIFLLHSSRISNYNI